MWRICCRKKGRNAAASRPGSAEPYGCVCSRVLQQEQRESPPQQRSFCPPPQQQSTSKTMTISQMQEQLLLSKHT